VVGVVLPDAGIGKVQSVIPGTMFPVNQLTMKKIGYYVKKVRLMPLKEVVDRIFGRFFTIIERFWIATGRSVWVDFKLEKEVSWETYHDDKVGISKGMPWSEEISRDDGLARSKQVQRFLKRDYEDRGLGNFYFGVEDRPKIVMCYHELYPGRIDETRLLADELCAHVIPIFEKPFAFGRSIPWLRDPLTEREWPLRYWAVMDTKGSLRAGGIKWIWELNRQQFLMTLAKAYFLTQNERYAEETCRLIQDWIHINRPLFGPNWASALECSVRIICWIWTLHFIRGSNAVKPAFLSDIYSSIYLQARYVETHLSTHSAANNHLIAEGAALTMVAICLPWFRSSDRWRRMGLEILTQQLWKNILQDGVFAEQSLHYGSFVVDFYLMILRLLRRNAEGVPKSWYTRLKRAGEFIASVMDAQGHVPNIGDNDDGHAVLLCESSGFNPYESILTTLSVLLKNNGFKAAGNCFDEKSFWLLGLEGMETFNNLVGVRSSIESTIFKDGGYCIFRDRHSVLTVDCGPLGHGAHAAHGHADAISITLSVQGRPLLIDPGMPYYGENPALRNHFRGTAAHNTVRIDGKDQSTMADLFLWFKKAESTIEKWSFTKEFEYFSGIHDGYSSLGVLHRRKVVAIKDSPFLGYWIIIDELIGTGQHFIELYWHFCAEGHVELRENGIGVLRVPETVLTLAPVRPIGLMPIIYMGNDKPFQGWSSPSYGKMVKSPVLCYQCRADVPFECTTIMVATHDSVPNGAILRDVLRNAGGQLMDIVGDIGLWDSI